MLWVQCGFVPSLRAASHPTQCFRSMPVLHCWHRLGLFSQFSLNLGFSNQFHKSRIIIFLITVKNAHHVLSFFFNHVVQPFLKRCQIPGGSTKATSCRVNRHWSFEYFAISLCAVNVIASHLCKMNVWNFTGVWLRPKWRPHMKTGAVSQHYSNHYWVVICQHVYVLTGVLPVKRMQSFRIRWSNKGAVSWDIVFKVHNGKSHLSLFDLTGTFPDILQKKKLH